MSRFFALPVGVLALCVVTALERADALASVRMDPAAILVTYLAFRFDVVGGAASAAALGLLLDVTAGAPAGLHMVSLAVVFVAMRALANALQIPPGLRLLPVAVAAAVGHVFLVAAMVGLFTEGEPRLAGVWQSSVPSLVANAVLALLLLPAVDAVGNRYFPEPDHMFR